jgi:outer membrane protein assembly factor BamB
MGGSLALSDDGIIFGLQAYGSFEPPVSVVALDADAGTVQWSVVIPQPYLPALVDGLALTPGASLLTLSKTGAIAIFAGKHRPSTTAPWSRWGGDNSNRSSAR